MAIQVQRRRGAVKSVTWSERRRSLMRIQARVGAIRCAKQTCKARKMLTGEQSPSVHVLETSSEEDRRPASETERDQAGDEHAALDEATNRPPAVTKGYARDARARPAASRRRVGRCAGEVGRNLVCRCRDAIEPGGNVKDVARGRGVEVNEHEAVASEGDRSPVRCAMLRESSRSRLTLGSGPSGRCSCRRPGQDFPSRSDRY